MTFRNLRLALVPVAVLSGGLLLVSNASASIVGTVLTGSTGNVTLSLNSIIFNADPAAIGGGNSDVANGTKETFLGCASGVLGSPGCLSAQEGVTVNNADLTSSAPSAANANTFLTFASHPNLVFSISLPGPGSPNTNCATANSNGLSCSVFAGSPIVLTYLNGHTSASVGVAGKASDTGVAGLASGSSYTGGFSQTFTDHLPNGNAPTPQNMQLYFCPSGACTAADFQSGKSVTTSQSGSFTTSAAIPEPLAGDYNGNGIVDAADYTIWRDTLGSMTDLRANGDNTGASAGKIDQADYDFWKSHFGNHAGSGAGVTTAVPEPATLWLLTLAMTGFCLRLGRAG